MYSLMKVVRAKYISRKAEGHVYKTITSPIVLYGQETWALIKAIEENLRCCERKVCPTRDENTQRYLVRTNGELKELHKYKELLTNKELKSLTL